MTNISTTLIENLTRNYIFYIPSEIYTTVENSEFKGLVPKEEYDKIVYYESKSKVRTTNLDQMILLDLMNKKEVLKQNVILLLEAKTSLSSPAFNIVLKDYQNHLKWHVHVSSWMHENLKSSFPNVKDVLINAFQFQSKNFRSHHLEIESHFQLNHEDVQLNNIDVINSLKTNFPETSKQNTVFNINQTNSEKSTISEEYIEEKQIITDEDIDDFLLETIFNVELRPQ